MVYSAIGQTYMRSGSHYTFIGGRPFAAQKFLATPPAINNDSFLCLEAKNVSDHVIIRIKRIYNYLINKANIYLSHIFENITRIIGFLCMCDMCMVCGVQCPVLL